MPHRLPFRGEEAELVGALSGKLEKLVLVGGEDWARQLRLQSTVDEIR